MHDYIVNEDIKSSNVFLVDALGKKRGIISRNNALLEAKAVFLDLVQVSVSDNEKTPVCKIMDYGKFKYKQSKKNKSKKTQSVKEIRISYRIASRDLSVKNNKVCDCLKHNHKVRYVLMLRGQEKRMEKEAVDKFTDILQESFADKASWSQIDVSGGTISTILKPLS